LESLATRAVSSSPPLHLVAVDGTCGNGHDTRFLAQSLIRLAGHLHWSILAFDVQQAALDAARALLARCNLREFCRPDGQAEGPWSGEAPAAPGPAGEVRFLLRGHERLGDIFALHAAELADENRQGGPEKAALAAVMYNLGFLPRSDRRIITRAQSTLCSLTQAAEALAPGGTLAVHAYGGHAGGREELAAVAAWFAALPHGSWEAGRYSLCNKPRNPEALFLALKR
jgi:SAM-dependent methyltransferase